MEVMHKRVAGLDVHKATVVACARLVVGRKLTRECRTFATTTAGLTELRGWLTAWRCTQVAMEATGVYWMPVWKLLSEGEFELTVANAAHIKNVPGRKTDLNDAMWIADLLAHGLIKASFVPDEAFQELRSLMRTRKQLVREQTRHVQRIQKTLEEANIKLAGVICDVMGVSGRRMIEAMIAGERDAQRLAALAERSLKASPQELAEALHGRLTEHHRFLLQLHLGQWDALDAAIRQLDEQTAEHIERFDAKRKDGEPPFRHLMARLCGIPGVSMLSATAILAEIGRDMGRFATAGHLISWAGLCPGQNESAGKRRSGKTRKGNRYLRRTLIQAALGATRKNGSALQARYYRVKRHRGHKKAVVAVGHQILEIAYYVMHDGVSYDELGADYFDRRHGERVTRRAVQLLERQGYRVTLERAA